MVKLTASDYELLEPGIYTAELEEVEDAVNQDGNPYLRWKFALADDDYVGRYITGLSSINFGPKAKARQWFETLVGRGIEPGETIDTSEAVGRQGMLVIGTKDRGDRKYSEIREITPVRRPKAR